MTLATPGTKAEHDALQAQVVSDSPDVGDMWIGLERGVTPYPKEDFYWGEGLHTGLKVEWQHFKDGEPNNEWEECVAIITNDEWQWRWNDESCTNARAYVCQGGP